MTTLLGRPNLTKIAFVCFLLSLPLSVRKVLWVFSPVESSGFNEYTDISLYLSDLTLGLFILILILENKKEYLSILWWRKLFHVEQLGFDIVNIQNVPRGTIWNRTLDIIKKCSTWNIFAYLVVIPIPFLLWSGVSIFWAESEILARYGFFKLLEGYILYLSIILLNVPRGTIHGFSKLAAEKCSTWNNSVDRVGTTEKDKLFHVEQLEVEKTVESLSEKNVPRGTIGAFFRSVFQKCSTWNIYRISLVTLILSGSLQAILGILQFFRQSSLGLSFLQESVLVSQNGGIAKIILFDNAIIRSYGLFPHPNLLGAFLGATLLLTLLYPYLFRRGMFHVEHFRNHQEIVPRGTIDNISITETGENCSTWNNLPMAPGSIQQLFHVEQLLFRVIYRVVLFMQLFGFLLTFSKAAYLSLFISASYLVYQLFHVEHCRNQSKPGLYEVICSTWNNCLKRIKMFHVEQFGRRESDNDFFKENVPRGTIDNTLYLCLSKICSTWNNWLVAPSVRIRKMFHVEQFIIATAIIALISYFAMSLNWGYFLVQPLQERLFLQNEFMAIIKQNPVQGTGIGQSVYQMQGFFQERLSNWQFQPIHNFFLLILAELGFVGIILFIWFLISVVRIAINVPRGTFIAKRSLVFSSTLIIYLGVLSLFDHYFWDIQQGVLLFWLFIGLIVMARYGIDRSIDKCNKA